MEFNFIITYNQSEVETLTFCKELAFIALVQLVID